MRGRRPTPLPKFRLLDPVLATAETLLAQGRLADVVSALPDERAAAERLNAVLADAGARPRLRHADGRWQVALVGRSGQAEQLLAAQGRTNGCSRRRCTSHRRYSTTHSTFA
jgi:hypothetical protein